MQRVGRAARGAGATCCRTELDKHTEFLLNGNIYTALTPRTELLMNQPNGSIQVCTVACLPSACVPNMETFDN